MPKSHLEMTVHIAEYHHLSQAMSESHLEQTVRIAEYRHFPWFPHVLQKLAEPWLVSGGGNNTTLSPP